MTDRELLEMAAKAAGIELCWVPNADGIECPAFLGVVPWVWWNPLNNDGDAMRLAVKLNLSMDLFDKEILVGFTSNSNQCDQVKETYSNDPYAATRRCIAIAAAQIGKELK